MKIVLASGSPRRDLLLRKAGVLFEIDPPDVPEEVDGDPSPDAFASAVARRKGEVVSGRRPDAAVVAADTVVAVGGAILGKPRDLDGAKAMLRALSGRPHNVLTAVYMAWASHGEETAFSESTRVTFRPLSEKDIDRYVRTVHVLDKAGAYAIQEGADLLGARVEGSVDNVVGLPVDRVVAVLREWGWEG